MKPAARTHATRQASARLLTLAFIVGVAAAGCDGPTIPRTGSVAIESLTTGSSLDPDGYLVVLDGAGTQMRIAPTGVIVVGGLAEGPHTLDISDVAPTCKIGRTGVHAFTVRPRDTTWVGVDVTCATPPGTVRVTLQASGTFVDSAIYYVIFPAPSARIAPGETQFMTFPAGTYQMQISGIAMNCRATSPNPATVTVTGGDTVDVSIAIECAAPSMLRVVVPTSGGDADDRYGVSVDGLTYAPVAANDSVDVPVSFGPHLIALTDVALNCAPAPPVQRAISVTAGETSRLVIDVSCMALPTLRVTVATTGVSPAAFTLYLDFDCSQYYYSGCRWLREETVRSNGVTDIKVGIGTHRIMLANTPSNCTAWGPNPRDIVAPQVGVVETLFGVTCR